MRKEAFVDNDTTIPTAKQHLRNNNYSFGIPANDAGLEKVLKEFAEWHVQAALRKASEQAAIRTIHYKLSCRCCDNVCVNKDSILKSYPNSNIE